jgi:hypothetical protein
LWAATSVNGELRLAVTGRPQAHGRVMTSGGRGTIRPVTDECARRNGAGPAQPRWRRRALGPTAGAWSGDDIGREGDDLAGQWASGSSTTWRARRDYLAGHERPFLSPRGRSWGRSGRSFRGLGRALIVGQVRDRRRPRTPLSSGAWPGDDIGGGGGRSGRSMGLRIVHHVLRLEGLASRLGAPRNRVPGGQPGRPQWPRSSGARWPTCWSRLATLVVGLGLVRPGPEDDRSSAAATRYRGPLMRVVGPADFAECGTPTSAGMRGPGVSTSGCECVTVMASTCTT